MIQVLDGWLSFKIIKNENNLLHLQVCLIRSDQIRSVAQSCPTLCDPMDYHTPGFPVHHQLPELTQTHPLSR